MVFNSIPFVVFFTLVCLLAALTGLPCVRKLALKHLLLLRHSILLAASYIFYGWWDWRFALLMAALTLVAYLCALALDKTGKKVFLTIGVAVPLIILGIFKYFNFFVDSFGRILGLDSLGTLSIILPVGISFYTFQSLSYTIDVYRQKIRPEKSFLRLALYISFFPQLVAGPIVKAGDFLPQLSQDRNISLKNFEAGIQYFVFGLFKKVVLADHISVCVDTIFAAPQQFHGLSILFAMIGYSIQIYCDFSGYSDMALGCAKCLGYDLMQNFNIPYFSRNISEFWTRWHISLSSWLREYLYIPLGGNRKGQVRTYVNLLLTMLLGGLWHGAAWTFVVWGGLHGAALCIHKLWMRATGRGKNHRGTLLGTILSGVATYAVVLVSWIFFRAPDFATAGSVLTGLLTFQDGLLYISSWTILGIVLVLLCSLAAVFRSRKNATALEGFYPTFKLDTIFGLTVFFVFLGITLGLAYTNSSPFIYFQF